MYNKYLLSLFVLFIKIIPGYCKWELIFIDEFDQNDLDNTKWHAKTEQDGCASNDWPTLDCKRNSMKNLRIINSTLVLAAVREDYRKREYTSAQITSKETFKVPFKVDVRAALPRGKMLHSVIEMKQVASSSDQNQDGEIVIASEHQTNELVHGFRTAMDNVNPYLAKYETSKILNEFHNYTIECTDTMLVWKFDNQEIDVVDITSYNITDLNFSILLTVNVGGVLFYSSSLSEADFQNWQCSLMIIDYVKVYTFFYNINSVPEDYPTEVILPPRPTNIFNYYKHDNSRKICAKVMEEIRPKIKAPRRVHGSIVVFTMVLLLLLIPLLVYLIVRQRKLKKKVNDKIDETYDDIIVNTYDDLGVNTYEDHKYAEYDEIKGNEYLEIETNDKYYYLNESENDNSNNYVNMDKTINN